MTKVKYTKLHPMASVPQKGTEQAAAYDLFSIEDVYIPVGETVMIRTGLAMEIPHGWKGEIYSRSGLASKGIVVANSPGKIDSLPSFYRRNARGHEEVLEEAQA
jgi:dUTP pyrophosphatase